MFLDRDTKMPVFPELIYKSINVLNFARFFQTLKFHCFVIIYEK